MSEAAFLSPFTAVASLGGSAGLAANTIGFVMQVQEHSNWCWAAVTASVCDNRGDTDPQHTTQWQLAVRFLGPEHCTLPEPSYDASWSGNQPFELRTSLCDLKRLDHTDDMLDMGKIAGEIGQRRPICLFIRLPTFGHCVAITGCDQATNTVYISDPDRDRRHEGPVALDQLGQHLGGQWQSSYFVK